MTRPLIIGQAPGPDSPRNEPPLAGRCGARLADLCGLTLPQFLRAFDRVNLVPWFPGKHEKGDLFPIDDARKTAVDLLLRGKLADRSTVMLGDGVARAFGLSGRLDRLRWRELCGVRVAFCPHPSGVNRWWNDEENEKAARRFWRRLAGS